MHNILLTVSYDGTDFCGWQRQDDKNGGQADRTVHPVKVVDALGEIDVFGIIGRCHRDVFVISQRCAQILQQQGEVVGIFR